MKHVPVHGQEASLRPQYLIPTISGWINDGESSIRICASSVFNYASLPIPTLPFMFDT